MCSDLHIIWRECYLNNESKCHVRKHNKTFLTRWAKRMSEFTHARSKSFNSMGQFVRNRSKNKVCCHSGKNMSITYFLFDSLKYCTHSYTEILNLLLLLLFRPTCCMPYYTLIFIFMSNLQKLSVFHSTFSNNIT